MQPDSIPIRNSVGIIIDDGTNWILQKRDKKDGILWPGKISMWGGVQELADESDSHKNAIRELYEETGIEEAQAKLVCYGNLSYEHQTLQEQLVRQNVSLYVAHVESGMFFHTYEEQSAYKIPRIPELEKLDMADFAPGVSEAIEKLIEYCKHEQTAA
jgi:8-oxo-dGTP pyrophosphatase MutT (NUDIX family)